MSFQHCCPTSEMTLQGSLLSVPFTLAEQGNLLSIQEFLSRKYKLVCKSTDSEKVLACVQIDGLRESLPNYARLQPAGFPPRRLQEDLSFRLLLPTPAQGEGSF